MILVVILACVLAVCQGASYSNYSTVYDAVFSNYNINLRPVLDDDSTINLTMYFVLLSLDDISENEQMMTTSGWIEMFWTDEILSWDPSQYNDVSELLVQQQTIWRPDVVVKNSVKKPEMMGYKEQPVSISDTGDVIWAPGDIFQTGCDLVVTYYPFDTQVCKITLRLWLSLPSEIRLISGRTDVSLEFFSENGQWEVVSSSAHADPEAYIPEVTFELKLKRRRLFYIVNVIIPILFLSCLGPLVFVLPADSGEKIGFCITVLLAYTVFLTIVGESMPQTSTQTSILSVYLSAMMAISAMSVLLTTVILKMYHKPEDNMPPKVVQSLFRGLRKVLCLKYRSDTAVTPVSIKQTALDKGFDMSSANTCFSVHDVEEISWKMVAEALDLTLLILFSTLTVIITVVCLFIMISG